MTSTSFQLVGLPSQRFQHLFELDDEALKSHGAVRRTAGAIGFPCRISLRDAAPGEELLLLPYPHLEVDSPYRASGPIFVRRGAVTASLPPGEVPGYVTRRQISVRAYDAAHMMIDAIVCEGPATREHIERMFGNDMVAYIQLHNAMRGWPFADDRVDHHVRRVVG